ncbi:hypothetical protein J6590_053639 [Homalodisca vitripennis]|nr:hypothetical protein J6590_053639 [Homalodisca vitripennis]
MMRRGNIRVSGNFPPFTEPFSTQGRGYVLILHDIAISERDSHTALYIQLASPPDPIAYTSPFSEWQSALVMIRFLLVNLVVAVCSAIIVHDDPPQQLYDFYYAGPELGFVTLPRLSRPVYTVARAILPNRAEPDTYDLHGLYHP